MGGLTLRPPRLWLKSARYSTNTLCSVSLCRRSRLGAQSECEPSGQWRRKIRAGRQAGEDNITFPFIWRHLDCVFEFVK
jgi:hypothetical protein